MTRTVETMTAREFERMRALTAIETYPDCYVKNDADFRRIHGQLP